MKFSFNLSEISLTLPYKEIKREKQKFFSDKFLVILVTLLACISVLAWYFYSKLGLILSYNDARSHLNVARRVFDSLQPGLAQIGSVWLPLYHVLELAFVWNDYMWRSGLAGSLVSMTSFILGGVYLFKLVKELKFDKFATILTLAVYALNPNLTFMQTTPMTESLLIFLSTAATYYAIRWAKGFQIFDLIAMAFFTYLTTLTRYDGWFLLFYIFIVTSYVAYKRKGFKFAEGNIIFFVTLAAFGVFLWFLWNLVIFRDPFYFIFGPFSAKSQQDILLAEGRLLTKGNLVYSIFIYLLTNIYNFGLPILVLSIVGMIIFIKSRISFSVKWAATILCVPFIFNIVSLYTGHSVIHIPGVPPYTWFNDRYGLMILPAVAVGVGFLVNSRKLAFMLVGLILLFTTLTMYKDNDIVTIQDGVSWSSGTYLDEASVWISENVDDGLILVAASSNDALLFKSGLKLKQFITEGARKYWDESIEDPTTYAKWIVMHKGDLVERNLRTNDNFLNNYKLVYKDAFTYIYLLEEEISLSLSDSDLPQ